MVNDLELSRSQEHCEQHEFEFDAAKTVKVVRGSVPVVGLLQVSPMEANHGPGSNVVELTHPSTNDSIALKLGIEDANRDITRK